MLILCSFPIFFFLFPQLNDQDPLKIGFLSLFGIKFALYLFLCITLDLLSVNSKYIIFCWTLDGFQIELTRIQQTINGKIVWRIWKSHKRSRILPCKLKQIAGTYFNSFIGPLKAGKCLSRITPSPCTFSHHGLLLHVSFMGSLWKNRGEVT